MLPCIRLNSRRTSARRPRSIARAAASCLKGCSNLIRTSDVPGSAEPVLELGRRLIHVYRDDQGAHLDPASSLPGKIER